MKNMHKVSDIVMRIFERFISKKKYEEISKDLGTRIVGDGRLVRIQCSIPKEIYMVLHTFGAFSNSESHFISTIATDYIEQRAIRMGIMNTIVESMSGGR